MLSIVTNRYVWNLGESCEEDSDCGDKCINYKCLQNCEDNNDCTYEDQCLNNICVPKYTSFRTLMVKGGFPTNHAQTKTKT